MNDSSPEIQDSTATTTTPPTTAAGTTSKGRTKICKMCQYSSPTACKRCTNSSCGAPFEKCPKYSSLEEKKSTNPTAQREMLEYRAKVLNHQHAWNIVVLYHRKHARGSTFQYYGTPGLASAFIGDGKSTSERGTAVLNLIEQYMESKEHVPASSSSSS